MLIMTLQIYKLCCTLWH